MMLTMVLMLLSLPKHVSSTSPDTSTKTDHLCRNMEDVKACFCQTVSKSSGKCCKIDFRYSLEQLATFCIRKMTVWGHCAISWHIMQSHARANDKNRSHFYLYRRPSTGNRVWPWLSAGHLYKAIAVLRFLICLKPMPIKRKWYIAESKNDSVRVEHDSVTTIIYSRPGVAK